jgi:hypothetical protein
MDRKEWRRRLLRVVKALQPNAWVKALSGAAVLWVFLPEDGSSASALHHAFQREAWREAGPGERVRLLVGFVLWAPVTLVLSYLCTRRCGPRVKRETGKGLARQVGEQLWLAVSMAVSPPWYYMFDLYDDTKRARAVEYIYRFETKRGLYDLLRGALSSAETTDALSDKALFAAHCEAFGVPAVSVAATATAGTIKGAAGVDRLPHQSLFFKPLRGAGGRGAERWVYGEDGMYHGADGETLDDAALVRRAKHLSRKESYVIRRYVTQHRDIADLSAGALSTVRVLSCLDENGRPEVTHAVLRMASNPDAVVDNFHAGGVAAKVDVCDGTLGRASDMGLTATSRWWESHPVTGARITGRKLPLWDEVLQVAQRAHAAFSDQVAVGWDIAVLDDGPSLVEGNKSPDLDIVQRIYEEPVGNSRFGELLAFHVARAVAARRRAPTPGTARPGGAGKDRSDSRDAEEAA